MIYPELEGVKYVCTDYLEEALSYTVIKLSYLSDSELTPYANNKEVLLSKYPEQAWKHAFEYLELNDMKKLGLYPIDPKKVIMDKTKLFKILDPGYESKK